MSRGSELRTIMAAKDENDFLVFAESLVDRIDKESKYQFFLIKGDYRIQFLRSRVEGSVLVSGRISLGSLQGEEVKEIVKVYRQLQHWLKQHYCNKLSVRNVNIPSSVRLCNKTWLGPYAKMLAKDGDVVLSQGQKAVVVFEIDDQS